MATETIEATDHKLLVAGERLETGDWDEVKSPYDGTIVGRVPRADAAVVTRAVDAAQAAFEAGEFPQHARAEVLDRAAHIVSEREDDLTATIAAEAGKPVKTARVEAQRCVGTLTFAAVEARKLTGEMVPMEAGPAGEGKLGFVLRLPVGVVGAISPFNFPLNLVAHKLGPSIAAGNATVLKPAGQTPISAIKLAEILYEAGLPENWLHVICGSGSEVGNAIVEDERIGAITFTGSAPVGWQIRSKAARKKVNLELGSTAPLIVNDDGIYSPGIAALTQVARRFGDVRVVAPDVEQSSAGHAITATRPVRSRPTRIFEGVDAFRVNGTPADCAALGIFQWKDVDVVLSGVNLGSNLGNATWHSGTLAAAKQATLLGIRGIALSAPASDEDVRYLDNLDTAVKDGDEVSIIPAVAGG